MSHILQTDASSYAIDGAGIAEMCRENGWIYDPNATTFVHYNGHGACEGRINIPGAKYHIGIVRDGQGKRMFAADPWKTGGLEDAIGANMEVLRQRYITAHLARAARREGYRVNRIGPGKIEIYT